MRQEEKPCYYTGTGLQKGSYIKVGDSDEPMTSYENPRIQMGETGDLGERFLDNKKIEGTIPHIIDQIVDFIVKNMKVKTIIREDNAKRDDKTEYPIPAIREAVINALEHRDYSTYTEGMSIQVRMFNDRIEIQYPGGLYGKESSRYSDSSI